MVDRENSSSSDKHLLDDDLGEWIGDEEEADDNPFCRCIVGLLCALACLAPLSCAIAGIAGAGSASLLLGVGLGVPIIACCILCFPVPFEGEDLEPSGCCGFRLNDAEFGTHNYFMKLGTFAKAAASKGFDGAIAKFRVKLRGWFEEQTDGDPNVGVEFQGNTEMYYSWADCRQRLTAMGSRISQELLKKENELALVVLNNSMGKFALGFNAEAHGLVRPYLAHMFDCAEGEGWTAQSLRTQFAVLFSELDILDHNLVTRNVLDLISPSRSKTIVTQMVLKILHSIALGMVIDDEEAEELAAMQTTDLLPTACPLRIAKSLCMTACLEKPVRRQEGEWCERYKEAILARWPTMAYHGGRPWTEASLNLMASAFLDAMLQAGGRSVPLAIDLVMGYILSKNRPPSLNGVNFEDETNIRALLFEAMRYHPPVTVVPTWTRDTPYSENWIHESICLDRALADEEVFPQPDVFDISRPNNEACSMAWADQALVNNDKANPNSHACPGRELSISMVIAFVKAFQAAGPWDYDDNINFNFYGTDKGFKCQKMS